MKTMPKPQAFKGGYFFALDGASGSGKSSIMQALVKMMPDKLRLIHRYTTRKRRPSDAEEEYIFISQDEYKKMVTGGRFIEHREYLFGMSYGTVIDEVRSIIDSGQNAIGIINLGNGRIVKERLPEAVTIFLEVPAEMIERRLRKRGTHTQEQIQERVGNARKAMNYASHYDHIVKNLDGKLNEAINQVKEIIASYIS